MKIENPEHTQVTTQYDWGEHTDGAWGQVPVPCHKTLTPKYA